jgi:S1-C subfamily serine protease
MVKRSVISILLLVLALSALGVAAQDDTSQDHPFLGILFGPDEAGALITQVMPDSPAADADIQQGDIITAVGDESVTVDNLRDVVQSHVPGDVLDLTILRDGESMDVNVTLGTMPDRLQGRGPGMPEDFEGDFIFFNGADNTWVVRGLSENNPLYEAGLRQGDTITEFNGEAYDPTALQEFIAGLDTDTVTVTVDRDDETMEIEVPAEALNSFVPFGFRFGGDGSFPFEMMPFNFTPLAGGYLGVAFTPLDEQVAEEHNLDMTEGALITEVLADSPAADAGLQADDVVTAVNNEPVDEEHTLRDRLIAYEPGDTVTLSIVRAGETMDIEATLVEPEMNAEFGQRGFPFGSPDRPQTPETPLANT